MELSGRRVAIIGGTSGIGRATAGRLASSGAQVIVGGRRSQMVAEVVREIGGSAQGWAVDACSGEGLRDFYRRAGKLDALVLTLGGNSGFGDFKSVDFAEIRKGFDAKVWPQLTAAQMGLSFLDAHGSLTFVTAASAGAPVPGAGGLACINGALEAMVPTLAAELKPIRVNAVSPGIIDTPWWDFMPAEAKGRFLAQNGGSLPVGRVGHPDDVAVAIEMIILNGFVTGTILRCDGGARLL